MTDPMTDDASTSHGVTHDDVFSASLPSRAPATAAMRNASPIPSHRVTDDAW